MAPAINLSGLPNVPMRVITMVLFVAATWATVGSGWLGISYILANYFVVLLGLWSERDSPSPIPVQFFFFGMIFTILNDIISVAVQYQTDSLLSGHWLATFRFNAAVCIILILAKPIACIFVYKEWQERVGGGGAPQNDSQYERLGGNQPTGGYNQGGYGGVYGEKAEPPQYQPPTNNQPFP